MAGGASSSLVRSIPPCSSSPSRPSVFSLILSGGSCESDEVDTIVAVGENRGVSIPVCRVMPMEPGDMINTVFEDATPEVRTDAQMIFRYDFGYLDDGTGIITRSLSDFVIMYDGAMMNNNSGERACVENRPGRYGRNSGHGGFSRSAANHSFGRTLCSISHHTVYSLSRGRSYAGKEGERKDFPKHRCRVQSLVSSVRVEFVRLTSQLASRPRPW